MARADRIPAARADDETTDREPDPRRYQVDLDWLWTQPPHNDGSPATVRLTVRDGVRDRACSRVASWLSRLPADEQGLHGSGGWTVRIVETCADTVTVDITSAGEDVADGIEAGTESAFDHLAPGTDLGLSWQQLPRGC